MAPSVWSTGSCWGDFDRDGLFDDVAAEAGVDNPEGRSFSAAMVDLDGDGWQGLYVANDVSPNALFRNMLGQPDLASNGPDKPAFWNLSAVTGRADFRGSMGLSVVETGDMTGLLDGLPDVAIAVNRSRPLLLHNQTSTHNRGVKIRLRGPAAACFGAKVEVTVGGSANSAGGSPT